MPSFDIISKTDLAEVDNAINGAMREIETRFDFKGTKCAVERDGDALVLRADDDIRLRQMHELIKTYLTRRKVDIGALEWKDPEKAAGDTLRQNVLIKQGIDGELARKIVKGLKDSKLKVQTAIQGDELRVSGKKRDDLQAAIQHVRSMKIEHPLQYVNFRD